MVQGSRWRLTRSAAAWRTISEICFVDTASGPATPSEDTVRVANASPQAQSSDDAEGVGF